MAILKNYLKFALIGLLLPVSALAGLPPTTATGQSETNKVTTFNLQSPNTQLTTTGAATRLLETGNGQLLLNPSFEATTYSSAWTISNSTGSQETTIVAAGAGLHAAKLSLSAQSGDLLVQSVTPAGKSTGQNYEASCSVNTTLTGVQLCSTVAGVEIQCSSVSSNGSFSPVSADMPGSDGSSLGLKIKATSSSTGSIYVDDCYVGKPRNIGTVQQAIVVGTITRTGCSGGWSTASTSLTAMTAPTGCTCVVTGSAQIGASCNDLSFKFASLGVGDYAIQFEGQIGQNTANKDAYFQFTDGTNTAREVSSVVSSTTTTTAPGVSQSFTYSTPQSNVTWSLYGKTDSGGGAFVSQSSGLPAVIRLIYYPSQSQQAVSPQQQRGPNSVKYTSGSGTYTPTPGTTYITVKMVGGGAGGSGGGTGTPGLGSNGVDSTFGTSLLVAGGGKAPTAQANSGIGGTSSLGTGPIGTAVAGGYGAPGTNAGGPTNGVSGGTGASSFYGGAGAGGNNNGGLTAGQAGVSNSGAGGGGGYAGTSTGVSGGGGGAGGYVDAIINAPLSSYPYTVGSGGSGGSAGLSGGAGGPGGSGYIEITEYFGNQVPILTGSITSNASGALRQITAKITGSATTPTIAYPADTWGPSTATRTSAGLYVIAINAGVYSATPYHCSVTSLATSTTASIGFMPRITALSSTSMTVFMVRDSSGTVTADDSDYSIECTGPR